VHEQAFPSQTSKIFKLSYYKNYSMDSNQILSDDKDLQVHASALYVDMEPSVTPVTNDKKPSQTNTSEFVVRDVGLQLDCLWSYQCSTTKGRNVSCIGWNVTNPVCASHKLLTGFDDCCIIPFACIFVHNACKTLSGKSELFCQESSGRLWKWKQSEAPDLNM